MREIKFRAWYKGKMYRVAGTWLRMVLLDTSTDTVNGSVSLQSVGIGDLELMQFTGLKDETGKEIYEGDIIKMEDATAKVVFWERPPAFGLDFYHNEDKWCEDWNLSDDSDRMEVIGNIYENEDLIKTEQNGDRTK